MPAAATFQCRSRLAVRTIRVLRRIRLRFDLIGFGRNAIQREGAQLVLGQSWKGLQRVLRNSKRVTATHRLGGAQPEPQRSRMQVRDIACQSEQTRRVALAAEVQWVGSLVRRAVDRGTLGEALLHCLRTSAREHSRSKPTHAARVYARESVFVRESVCAREREREKEAHLEVGLLCTALGE